MVKRIRIPLDDAIIRNLRIGDAVLISGTIFTARDMAHKWLVETGKGKLPGQLVAGLKNGVIYHCGPVVEKKSKKSKSSKKSGAWRVIAASPTTSKRMESSEPAVIERFGVRAILGKGGMLGGTRRALVKHGCVYVSLVGGAAALLATKIVAVRNVYMLKEFGSPEAVWELEVKDMPGVVSMDAKGGCLIKEVFERAKKRGVYSTSWNHR